MSDDSWTTPPGRADYLPGRGDFPTRGSGYTPGSYSPRPTPPPIAAPPVAPPAPQVPAAAPPGSSIGSHRAGTVWESPRKSVAPAAASQRGVRKVKLTLARLDPWSALKTTFVFGLAGLIVLLVAVSLLYGLIDAMGVLASLRKFLNDVDTSHSGAGVTAWLGFGRIFLISALLGLINVILLTAIVTMGAFIYNVSTDVVGGVDMTFAERS